jgi:hypothetical protein
MPESHYDRLKKVAEYAKNARTHTEHAGVTAWKEGRKGEALKLLGGANAPMFQAILGGAGLYYAGTSDWFSNIQVFKDHWYLKPLLVLGIGFWLWRKGNAWAGVFLSAGAALFVQALKEDQRKRRDEEARKGGTNTSGVDTGAFDWSDDTYGHGRWIDTPSGARAYMTEGAGARAADRIAERVFEHARSAA